MRNAGTPTEGMPLGSCEVGDAARTPDPHVLREEVRADHNRSRERLSGYALDSREEREPQSDHPARRYAAPPTGEVSEWSKERDWKSRTC
jgi:hypothetical protein